MLLAGTFAAVLDFGFVPVVYATEIFSDDFEDGTLDAWTESTSSGDVTINATSPHAGSYHARFFLSGGNAHNALLNRSVTSTAAANASCWMKFETEPEEEADTFQFLHLYAGTTTLARVNIRRTGGNTRWTINYRDLSSSHEDNSYSGSYPSNDTYYQVKLNVTVGDGDGAVQVSVGDTLIYDHTGLTNNDAGNITNLKIGTSWLDSNVDMVFFVDDVVVTSEDGEEYTAQDIQDAIDALGGEDGEVVLLAETYQFSNDTVTIPGGVNVTGAGIGNTILRQIEPAPFNKMFYVDGSNGKQTRISGIQFEGNVTSADDDVGASIGVYIVEVIDFRIDHCKFTDFPNMAIGVGVSGMHRQCRGVIDHNDFDNPYKDIYGGSWAYGIIVTGGAYVWHDNINDFLGKYETAPSDSPVVYIEDNNFSRCRHAIASNQGAWYVARYNTIREERPPNFGSIDVHGSSGATAPGGRGLEAYNNTIIGSVDYDYADAFWIRGGGGVIYDNTMQNIEHGIGLYRDSEIPAYQVKDLYIWDNTMDGGTLIDNYAGYTEDVDYFLYEKPGYTPYIYPHPLVSGEEATYYYLNVTDGTGGTTDPAGGSEYPYLDGSYAVIEAFPESGYSLATPLWTLDAGDGGSDNPTSVLMDENHTILANFDEIPEPQFSSHTYSSTTHVTFCDFGVTVTDNVDLSHYIFSTNNTGVWVNGTTTAFASNPQTVSISKVLNGSVGVTVQWLWYANDTSDNWGTSATQSLVTTDDSIPNFGYVTGNTTVANAPVTYSCIIGDDVDVSGSIASWNNTGTWTNATWTSGSTGTLSGTHNSTIGYVISVIFYANDTSNNWGDSGQYNFTLTSPTYLLSFSSTPSFLTQGATVSITVSVTREGVPFTDYILNVTRAGSLWKQNIVDANSTFNDMSTVATSKTYSVLELYDNELSADVGFSVTDLVLYWNIPSATPPITGPTQPPAETEPTDLIIIPDKIVGEDITILVVGVAVIVLIAVGLVFATSKEEKQRKRWKP